MIKLSVIINTCKRSQQARECIESVIQNNFKLYEIIVIEQKGTNDLQDWIIRNSSSKVKYYDFSDKGGSFANNLNFGIKKAKGKIIVFISDDCLASKNWLEQIYLSFQNNKSVMGLFGQVLPYNQRENKGKICPCTFLKTKKKIIKKPTYHVKEIGYASNMSYKKEVFEKNGGFREWLGPGTTVYAAEDAEFAMRLLLRGDRILYNPSVRVYHNRWITEEKMRKQLLFYNCGEVACYGYYAFLGKKFAGKIVKNNFKSSYKNFLKSLKLILSFKRYGLKLFSYAVEDLYFKTRGFLTAFYYFKVKTKKCL